MTTRLAYSFGVRVSGDTLIRRIMRLPLSEPEQLTHIGVDDWAWRKGHHYGTIIVDQSTHRPVALLSGRSATSLAEWLKTRPEIKIITRDRAGAYADVAKTGASQAIQIADRWHLIRNAGDHFERFLKRHWVAVKETYHAIKTQELSALQSEPIITVSPQQETVTQQQRRLLFEHISVLKNKGMAQTEIALTAGISDKTVRRWLQTGGPPLCGKRPRPRQVIGFNEQTWLREQGNSGCHNAALLFRKLKTRGYVGGSATVRSLVSQWRYTSAEVLQYPPMPRLKQVMQWLTSPLNLDKSGAATWIKRFVQQLLTLCPGLNVGCKLTQGFISLFSPSTKIKERSRLLRQWLHEATHCKLSEYQKMASSLEMELDAVENALTHRWSNGVVEGHVNRLKMLKRQMYGRAGFELLSRRVMNTLC